MIPRVTTGRDPEVEEMAPTLRNNRRSQVYRPAQNAREAPRTVTACIPSAAHGTVGLLKQVGLRDRAALGAASRQRRTGAGCLPAVSG